MSRFKLPVSYAAILIQLAKQYGGRSDTILSHSGLSPEELVTSEARISTSQFKIIYINVHNLCKTEDLGLTVGSRMPLTSHGVLGYALMSCDNIHQVTKLLLKYYELVLETASLELCNNKDYADLFYQDNGTYVISPVTDKEIFFSSLVNALKQLLHQLPGNIEVFFDYPAPKHLKSYQTLFGEGLHFDHNKCFVRLPKDILHAKPELANPVMLDIYQQQCDKLLAQMQSASNLEHQLRNFLLRTKRVDGQTQKFPTLTEAAQHFNMSSRSLRRHLKNNGLSYQNILDNVRAQLAEKYLGDQALSVSAVAELLGFHDAANFRRAFIRWRGLSPACYKKKLRPSD